MPQNIYVFGISLYNLAFYFIIYAFLGWFLEVVYAAVSTGKFVNRGFLNGPYCPIYGFGVNIILVSLMPISHRLGLLFIGSFFITTALEYLTGFVLEKLFHTRWWDYSDLPFNINGYVCLKFSLAWSFACIAVIRIIHPIIERIVGFIPHLAGSIILAVLFTVLIVDTIATVSAILKLNSRLKTLDEIASHIRQSTDAFGENIYEEAIELKQRYDGLLEQRKIIHSRILNAFPNMRSEKYAKALEELKQRIKIIK